MFEVEPLLWLFDNLRIPARAGECRPYCGTRMAFVVLKGRLPGMSGEPPSGVGIAYAIALLDRQSARHQ